MFALISSLGLSLMVIVGVHNKNTCLVADSCAPLSRWRFLTTLVHFLETAMTMGEYFGGVIAPDRVSGCFCFSSTNF
jgi:hypothetical protein